MYTLEWTQHYKHRHTETQTRTYRNTHTHTHLAQIHSYTPHRYKQSVRTPSPFFLASTPRHAPYLGRTWMAVFHSCSRWMDRWARGSLAHGWRSRSQAWKHMHGNGCRAESGQSRGVSATPHQPSLFLPSPRISDSQFVSVVPHCLLQQQEPAPYERSIG